MSVAGPVISDKPETNSLSNVISVVPNGQKKLLPINGKQIAYLEQGSGDPIVFVHGGFGSALIWRKLLPLMSNFGRCIALDLPGYGESSPYSPSLNLESFVTQQRQAFDDFLKAIGVTGNITLFVHGVTGISVLDWAFYNSDSIKAIAHAAGCFVDSDKTIGLGFLDRRRSPGAHELFLDHGHLIGHIVKRNFGGKLPDSVLKDILSPMFGNRQTRAAIAGYLFNIPSYGKPALSHESVLQYTNWLRNSPIPKLRIKSGEVTRDLLSSYQKVTDDFRNQKDVEVEGGLFLPEENPIDLANALINWLEELGVAEEGFKKDMPIGSFPR